MCQTGRSIFYMLEGHTPVAVSPLDFMGSDVRKQQGWRVARTLLGEVEVVTTFLGVDQSMVPTGPPLLFETLVFGGKVDGVYDRYPTWEAAERGHALMVEFVELEERG
jgi:hypothetical protein